MADVPPSVVDAEIRAAADRLGLPDAEQLELIRDQVPNRDAGTAVEIARRAGRGRPPGALNRQNKDFRAYVLAQHSHPGIALARTYDRPVELLAAELGCTLLEAKALQDRAAAELLPYIESKMPTQIAAKLAHDLVMIVATGNATGEQLAGIGAEIAAHEGRIDWNTVEVIDVAPSLKGGLERDASDRDA